MNWLFWRRRKPEWEIQPLDVHWLGYETSLIISDGWEPFGVSAVPNTLNSNQIRIWRRRPKHGPRPAFGYEVKVQSAGWGGHQVILHLTEGWEPFGLSISPPDQPIVWFRRRAT